jgi:hypothetical protein
MESVKERIDRIQRETSKEYDDAQKSANQSADKPQPKKIEQGKFNLFLNRAKLERNRAIEKAAEEMHCSVEDLLKEGGLSIRAHISGPIYQAILDTAAQYLETFRDEIWIKEDHYPLDGMLDGGKIEAMLERCPKFTPFVNCIDSISEKSKKDESTDRIVCRVVREEADETGKKVKRIEWVERRRSYFVTNKNFYLSVKKYFHKRKLKISPTSIRRFLKALCGEGGFYERKQRRDEHGHVHYIYYDGCWLENPGHPARKIRLFVMGKRKGCKVSGKKFLEDFNVPSNP